MPDPDGVREKKNKAVILISTMHDRNYIDDCTGKPEVTIDHNITKEVLILFIKRVVTIV